MSATRFPIASLPLPPVSDRLCQNLTPDPATPSINSFQRDVLRYHTSLQRRSRLVSPSAHFSFVVPLPLPFPYRIPQPENPENREASRQNIEEWLSARSPLNSISTATVSGTADYSVPHLRVSSSSGTNEHVQQRHLLALSEACIHDCLPHLDIGDAMEHVSSTSGADSSENREAQQKMVVRQELIDVLSGESALMTNPDDSGLGYAPWSLRYCGHQFGVWAGQLGDGRAISISTFKGSVAVVLLDFPNLGA